MDIKTRWALRGAVALVALSVAMLVQPPAVNADNCSQPPNVGTCPPLDPESCYNLCRNTYQAEGGNCMPGSGCCACYF